MHLSQHDIFTGLAAIAILFFAVLTVYKKWLTRSGAIAACCMAAVLYMSGGYIAFIVPGIFFITGSLLSKLNKQPGEKKGRNALQVFANGITAAIFMIVYGSTKQEIYLISAMASFCISMADTVSSEIGVYYKGITLDILSFKKMDPGISGGISLEGTMAGLAGAFVLSFVAGFCYNFSFGIFLMIAAAGFAGMLTDSLLGSWLQVRYKTSTGILTEDAVEGSKKVKGLSWCNNDMVNIISNILVTLLFFFIFWQIS
jgi:uncharacterized protein (TIGR00297 family)